MSQNEIAGLNHQIQQTERELAFIDKVTRLMEDPVFKEVIIEGFGTKHCARYLLESCDSTLDSNGRADALAMAQAGANIKRWLAITLELGKTARNSIEDWKEQIEYLRQNDEDVE